MIPSCPHCHEPLPAPRDLPRSYSLDVFEYALETDVGRLIQGFGIRAMEEAFDANREAMTATLRAAEAAAVRERSR